MERRLARAMERWSLAPPAVALVIRGHRAAMARRRAPESGLESEQDPAFLHPGRTVLILLQDVGERDESALAAGAIAESRDPALRVSPELARAALFGVDNRPPGREEDAKPAAARAIECWTNLPAPDWRGSGGIPDERLLEELVTAPPVVARVALAEALDHLRHAHLWPSRRDRARARELAEGVFYPIAPRVHGTLARRLDWWIRRVGSGGAFRR